MLSRLKREVGISLETLQWKRASSRFEGRISWFFSSCGSKIGVLNELQLEPQGPACGSFRNVQSSCEWRGASQDSSIVTAGAEVLNWIEARTPRFLSSANMDLGVPLEFPQGSQASSRVETCKSILLSSWKSNFRLPVVLT